LTSRLAIVWLSLLRDKGADQDRALAGFCRDFLRLLGWLRQAGSSQRLLLLPHRALPSLSLRVARFRPACRLLLLLPVTLLSHSHPTNRYVFQGVHMLLQMTCSTAGDCPPWDPSEKRVNRIVFIGRNLDREALTRSFEACLVQADTTVDRDVTAAAADCSTAVEVQA
jgi:hypothetical protein